MADLMYDYGLDEGATWATNTFRFLLLKGSGYAPSKAHHFVSSLTPGSNEVTVSAYARQTAASKARTVDAVNHRIVYSCANPDFGVLAAGETVSAMVLFRFVTNDADSILIAYYDLTDFPTDGTDFLVQLGTTGAFYLDAP